MMLTTDPIAELLARVHNAALNKRATVQVPYSKVKHAVLRVLSDAGWIGDVAMDEQAVLKSMTVQLKYDENGRCVIQSLRRVSTPGRRVYVNRGDLPIVENNFGIAVISTSKGMMTNREARKRGLGGEVICEVS